MTLILAFRIFLLKCISDFEFCVPPISKDLSGIIGDALSPNFTQWQQQQVFSLMPHCSQAQAADGSLTRASMYSTRRSNVVSFSLSVASLDRHDMS